MARYDTPLGSRASLGLDGGTDDAPGRHVCDRRRRERRLPNSGFASQAATPTSPATMTHDNVNNIFFAPGSLWRGEGRGCQALGLVKACADHGALDGCEMGSASGVIRDCRAGISVATIHAEGVQIDRGFVVDRLGVRGGRPPNPATHILVQR